MVDVTTGRSQARTHGGHRRHRQSRPVHTVAVIGLGRFGEALARELADLGVEVLGVDRDEDIVQRLAPHLTTTVRADATRLEVLEQLGVLDVDRVVVAVGSDLEASILTTSLLRRAEVKDLWAKAVSETHGLILEQLGVPHVIRPEADMGRRVAHLVAGAMQDFVDYGHGLAMAKVHTPRAVVGKSLGPRIEETWGVRVLLVLKPDAGWLYPDELTVADEGDVLIVAGTPEDTEEFANLT